MVTTHQIRNVLRIYGDQLKRRNTLIQESRGQDQRYADRVNISTEARHRQAINNMSLKIMSQMPSPPNPEASGEPETIGREGGRDTAE